MVAAREKQFNEVQLLAALQISYFMEGLTNRYVVSVSNDLKPG
jgi:hypothetical protein